MVVSLPCLSLLTPLSFSPLSRPFPLSFSLLPSLPLSLHLLPQNISIAVVGENKNLEIYDNEKVDPFVSHVHTQGKTAMNMDFDGVNRVRILTVRTPHTRCASH